MDYAAAIDAALGRLHAEGRYRVFIDIERQRGRFPRALWRRPDGTSREIVVWCGNDYLGMGQHPAVIEAMHAALDAGGAGSGIVGASALRFRLRPTSEVAAAPTPVDGITIVRNESAVTEAGARTSPEMGSTTW